MAETPQPAASPGPSDDVAPDAAVRTAGGAPKTAPDAAVEPLGTTPPETAHEAPSLIAAVQPGASEAAAIAARELAAGGVIAREAAVRGRAWWGSLDPTTKRPTVIVALLLITLVVGTQILNAIIPGPAEGGSGPGTGTTGGATTIDLGLGVSVTPPAGWVVVGPAPVLQGVRLQRGGVVVDLLVAPYKGTPTELLTTYVNQVLVGEAISMTLHDVVVAAAGNGHPAARATYDGIFKGAGHLEGEVSTQVVGGTGVIIDAAAPRGTLSGALRDVHQMLGTIEVRQ